MTGADDPALVANLEGRVGGLETRVGALEVTTARHERQIYGDKAENIRGILPRLSDLELWFGKLAKRVDDLSDGKKTLLTLLGLGVTSLGSIGSLLASLAAVYVALAK